MSLLSLYFFIVLFFSCIIALHVKPHETYDDHIYNDNNTHLCVLIFSPVVTHQQEERREAVTEENVQALEQNLAGKDVLQKIFSIVGDGVSSPNVPRLNADGTPRTSYRRHDLKLELALLNDPTGGAAAGGAMADNVSAAARGLAYTGGGGGGAFGGGFGGLHPAAAGE